MNTSISRRALLAAGAALTQAARGADAAPGRLKVAIFSKHLQFLAGEELAAAAAKIGFDGIDIDRKSTRLNSSH